jgi:hypothetical protein
VFVLKDHMHEIGARDITTVGIPPTGGVERVVKGVPKFAKLDFILATHPVWKKNP